MNRELFSTSKTPTATATNGAGGAAFARTPEEALAQYACTGCLTDTFYASASDQLDEVLKIAAQCTPDVVAEVAIYARARHMKDLPTLLVATLAARGEAAAPALRRAFPLVVDNARQIRGFAQIIRSGRVGRKSFGSLPKRLIRDWFAKQSPSQIYRGAVGDKPSLSDVVRMVHVTPSTPSMAALFRHLLGRPLLEGDVAIMPSVAVGIERFRQTGNVDDMPADAPFMMLTAHATTREHWTAIAKRASWTETRINLATFKRHGVFEVAGMTDLIASRLRDPALVAKTRVLPFEILSAYKHAEGLPRAITEALQDALDLSLANVPALRGSVVIAIDVSGSMSSPVTGQRGSTPASKVRCIDAAALFAAAMLRTNPNAIVIPFDTTCHAVDLNPRDSVMANAQKLAAFAGGGTDCSAPIRALQKVGERGGVIDHVVMISDNESWADSGWRGTGLSEAWAAFKRYPSTSRAKLYTIDITPSSTTQTAPDRADTIRVGGFSDAVFDVVAAFSNRPTTWLGAIREANARARGSDA